MKAFHVRFDTANTSGFSEILLVNDEEQLERALEAKSLKHFKAGKPYNKITDKEELPLGKVKIAELSITEFLLLKDM